MARSTAVQRAEVETPDVPDVPVAVVEQAAEAVAEQQEAAPEATTEAERPAVHENVQPNTKRSLDLRSGASYERIMAAREGALAGWHIAWVRPGYAMLKTGARGEWATVCVHGTVQKVAKGALAEQAGRNRATWCESCQADSA